ncbi:TPA: hypothetical protein ACPZRY_001506 [Yersinia enterocolitica]|uniref:hypothetical protein n=1 Tax=Yersinia enterocolitica TaxID=630 RepID=UPI0028BA2CD3|nr:hypothetical protein [Yersinia enterocolitica]EKN4807961.1 hypothetical protein [Yersinia enterocolitica]ELI8098423.1 hypothetical protein [Yersinia enterocolitica]HDL7326927.1 hypothetical protein [Yersinia enterocolitica]HDL7335167.1 hypothetical protein [Yersinia enterocolitica]
MTVISSATSNPQVVITNDDQKDKSDSNNITLKKIKVEIVTAFTGIEYDADSKISKLIERNTNATTLREVMINVNKYLKKSKGTYRCDLFISNIGKKQDSELNKNYKLENHSNGLYQFIDRKYVVDDVCSSEVNEEVRYKESQIQKQNDRIINEEKIKKELQEKKELKEEIERINNNLGGLEHRDTISRGLVAVSDVVFECKTFSGSDRIKKKHDFLKSKNIDSSCLIELKEHIEQLEGLEKLYIDNMCLNMEELPKFHKDLESVKNEGVRDAAKMINTLIESLSYKEKTIRTRVVNIIASFLFPNLFKNRESEKMQFVGNIINLKELITDLNHKPGYENLMKAKWLYGLVTQMLVKGTPAQYPFDPLDVLSPDRKVWLELQKEWLKPLEPKSMHQSFRHS